MTRLETGLCSVTFRDLPYGEVLSHAATARIAAIEWGADRHVPPGDLARAAAVARESRERGIAVASYGSYFEAGVTPLADFAIVAETARALGAPNVRVWAGRRGVDSKDVARADRERAVHDLQDACQIAAAAGLTVALEFHRQTLTDTLSSALDLIASVAHPALYSYWQPRGGIGLDESIGELDALRPRLSHLHVFNWNAQRERFPLDGAGDFWPAIFEHVAGWNGHGPVRRAFLEFVAGDDPAAFARDAMALRTWVDRANDVHGKRCTESDRPQCEGTNAPGAFAHGTVSLDATRQDGGFLHGDTFDLSDALLTSSHRKDRHHG
jgi:sugar phosphate isomerase/epimerase